MADAHANFAYSTVATAPSPASSGVSLVVAAGDGALFPTPPFNATVWPASAQPLSTNAEIVRVTAISTDTLTIARAQESSSARSIVVGDQIAATVTKKTLTDIEPSTVTDTAAANKDDYDLSAGKFARLTPSASFVITGILAGSPGEEKTLTNLSADKIIVLAHENAGSSAANRLATVLGGGQGHLVLLPGEEVRLVYDGTSSRWRVAAHQRISDVWVRRSLLGVANGIASAGVGLANAVTGTVRAIPSTPASYIEAVPRTAAQTSTSAGNVSTQRANNFHCIQGNAAGRGGVYVQFSVGGDLNPSTAAARFAGLSGTTSAHGNVDASTLTNIIGIGHDPAQTTFRVLNNDGSGTATAADLGANFPVDTTSCFGVCLFTPPNGSQWAVAVWRTDDLTVTPKVFDLSSDIPANTQPLCYQLSVCNRAAGAAYAFSHMYMNSYTPN